MQKLDILFQDDWIVVVNKPSGLLSVSFEGNRSRTAQQMLGRRFCAKGARTAQSIVRLPCIALTGTRAAL